jgi:hypothetical protein
VYGDQPPGMVEHACNPSYAGDGDRRMVSSRQAWAKVARSCLKNKIQKGGGPGSSGTALASPV